MRAGGRACGNLLVPAAAAALWGRAEAKAFLISSITKSTCFSRYYILQILYLPCTAAIFGKWSSVSAGALGLLERKGDGGRSGQGSKISAGTHSWGCVVITVYLGAWIINTKHPTSPWYTKWHTSRGTAAFSLLCFLLSEVVSLLWCPLRFFL